MTEHRISDHYIIFNTGCPYTEEGQIIVAGRKIGDELAFWDHSRQIGGHIRGNNPICRHLVRDSYLNGRFEDNLDYRQIRELESLAEQHKHHVIG